MTAAEKIQRYLSRRATPATAREIAKTTGVSLDRTRHLLPERFARHAERRCRVTGQSASTWGVRG